MEIKLVEFAKGVYSVYTSRDVFLGTFELDVDGFYYFLIIKTIIVLGVHTL